MKILFSPLGKTDPVSNLYDGAMIHICRHYLIDKVYLYMSKEICEINERDGRYTYCLEKLAEKQNRRIEYEIIERPELTEVHVFDYFIEEFRTQLLKIYNEMPGAEIYVNVSSGTPAMKSTLISLAALMNIGLIPIQVSTPEKRSNPNSYSC